MVERFPNINMYQSDFASTSNFEFNVSEKLINDTITSIPRRSSVFFKFESFPQKDEIDNISMQNVGLEAPIIEEAAFGNGFRLRPTTVLSFPYFISNTRQFSIGFWWRPVNQNPTFDPNTGSVMLFRTPVLSKSNFSIDNVSGVVSATNASFVIYEESRDNDENVMKILLESDDNEQVIIYSERYKANQFHYFWIVFNGISEEVSLFIDGLESDLEFEQGDFIPSRINNVVSVPVRINDSAIGQNNLLRNTHATIDELFIIDRAISDPFAIARHINFGSEYEIDVNLRNRDRVYCKFAFNDPTTLSLTSVVSNGTNVYVGRADGKVFRGDRFLWQSRRDFANRDEINFLNKSFLSEDSSVSIDSGFLSIFQANVRI